MNKQTQRTRDKNILKLAKAYKVIIDHLKLDANLADNNYLANFDGSPERCAKALLDNNLPYSTIIAELIDIVGRTFPVMDLDTTNQDPSGMITQGPISVNSMCPHHLYPVRYEAWLSYIPKNGKVLGLSKLARIVKLLGHRPVLQEQLAVDVADVLHTSSFWPSIESAGSAVTLIGTHTCMACRGVESDARTTVTELRGCYWENNVELKYQAAVQLTRGSKTF